jgi:hypothetical protein
MKKSLSNRTPTLARIGTWIPLKGNWCPQSTPRSFLGTTILLGVEEAWIRTYEPLIEGATIEMTLHLVEKSVDLKAHVEEAEEDPVGVVRAWVRFHALPQRTRELLARHIEQLQELG